MLETIGIILIVQGVGGVINRLAESESKGWWLQLHLLPDALHLPVSVAMGVVGALLVLRSTAGKRRRKSA
ncbi:hypothetical protein K1T35_33215 [Pseudonocardia sp. DSM 110487]|uniref:hypothetical protein n=1 Tax=Pseudonocardia sp. DSM 110487 TaxID=2865833 RepID=UPI001C6A28B5|nr:hypothetical protein [Pseudonocardia sp. DSM 110487]QYN33345.1 hypothetical protein K1T35_33215 [Pseudonocardia sp. DSM 110487]